MWARGRRRAAILTRHYKKPLLLPSASALRAHGQRQDVGQRARRHSHRRDTPRLTGALPLAGLLIVRAPRARRAPTI